MKVWQVQIRGEGFKRGLGLEDFELSGFVEAASANDAFHAAVEAGKRSNPELEQAGGSGPVRPVINTEEIVEVTARVTSSIGEVEIIWFSAPSITGHSSQRLRRG